MNNQADQITKFQIEHNRENIIILDTSSEDTESNLSDELSENQIDKLSVSLKESLSQSAEKKPDTFLKTMNRKDIPKTAANLMKGMVASRKKRKSLESII